MEQKENVQETKDTNEFKKSMLITDFAQAFDMLRHYDNVNWNLTKFSFSQVIVTIGACWAIMRTSNSSPNILSVDNDLVLGLLLLLSSVFVYITMIAIVKNRRYFARTCHYINEHRNNILQDNPINFKNESQMWVDKDYPKPLDWGSTQMMCFYLLAISFILMFASSAQVLFALASEVFNPTIIFWGAFVIAVALSLISLYWPKDIEPTAKHRRK